VFVHPAHQRILHTFVVLGLLLMLVLPLAFLPQAPGPFVPLPGGVPKQTPVATAPPVPAAPPGDSRFLIVGLTQDEHRTDSIIVVQWDEARHEARILGVPRDIAVNLDRIGTTKLVHAYATGGIGRARAAVVKLLDIPISHYIVFSLPAMRHLVDLIGGVPLTVEKRMVYTDREQGLYIDLQPGPQVLDGARAEEYVRFRNDPEGDIGRIHRQQHFLRAALTALRRPAVWIRLPRILETAQAEIGTDLTKGQLLGWAGRAQGLSADAISAYSIEGQPVDLYDNLMHMKLSFWQPDPDDLRAKVRWLLTGITPPPTKP